MLSTPLPSPLGAAPALPCPVTTPAAPLPPLHHYLDRVPDPRDPRGRRHPLGAVLSLVVCALLCGARHLTAIRDWGRDHSPDLRRALGFTHAGAPCLATLHYLLQDLDWAALEAELRAWVAAVAHQLGQERPDHVEEALAIDGKTMRGALKQAARITATVSALGHRLGLTASVGEVRDGDEIGAVEALLEQLVLVGKVVTLDALHTQRETARRIGARGGEYVMIVKGNQPDLEAAVQELFAPERAREQDRASAWTTETGHGRVENRSLVAVSVPPTAPEALHHWPGVQQAFVVHRQGWRKKQRRGHQERVYGITSLTREQAGPADLLRLVRGHWRVETRSHYVRDVTFGEDAGQVRTGNLPQVLALLRTLVITRLRAAGVTNIARETRRLTAQPNDCLRLLGLLSEN